MVDNTLTGNYRPLPDAIRAKALTGGKTLQPAGTALVNR